MTHPKDIKISQREQFALLNDPDFLNQAITRFLQQFMEAEITSFLQAGWSYPASDAVAEFYAAKAAKDDVRVSARGVSLSQA